MAGKFEGGDGGAKRVGIVITLEASFFPVPKGLVLRARPTVWSILLLKKRPSDKPPNS